MTLYGFKLLKGINKNIYTNININKKLKYKYIYSCKYKNFGLKNVFFYINSIICNAYVIKNTVKVLITI